MISYLRVDGASLPSVVGRDDENNYRVSDGQAGHLSFGPYFSAEAGKYIAGFYMRRLGAPMPGRVDIDVFANGAMILALKQLAHGDLFDDIATFVDLPFSLDKRTDRIEVRVFVHPDVRIEIQELAVFATSQRAWSAK